MSTLGLLMCKKPSEILTLSPGSTSAPLKSHLYLSSHTHRYRRLFLYLILVHISNCLFRLLCVTKVDFEVQVKNNAITTFPESLRADRSAGAKLQSLEDHPERYRINL